MSVQIGTAADYADLLNKLDTFLTTNGKSLVPSFVGTGTGTIAADGGTASVAETITVTFSSATAFAVAGSVSGALGTGVVGTAFTSTKANLTITAGGTAFVSGDVFTFAVTPPWTSLRRVTGSEMIWEAPGNGGLDQIIVGAITSSNVSADYWNWRLGGFTAFNSAVPFAQQSGYVGGNNQAVPSPVLTLWDGSIPYWFVANGRRVIIVAQISTVFVAAYLGFLSSYMAPGAFPYPLLVGGSMAWNVEPGVGDTRWRWSYAGGEIRCFPLPQTTMSNNYQSSLMLRKATGQWLGFDLNNSELNVGKVWPSAYVDYAGGGLNWWPNLDGSYPLLPVVLSDASPNVYGELDGVFATAGYLQAVLNTITINGIPHLVVQNVFRTSKADYFVVRLA